MSGLFEYSSFNGRIDHWDTSRVVNMSFMFYGAEEFNQKIGGWDTASVTDMSYMFGGARSFNKHIGGWDVSSVTDMSYMFASASSFNKPIGGWDVSSLKIAKGMFFGAASFKAKKGWMAKYMPSARPRTTREKRIEQWTHVNYEPVQHLRRMKAEGRQVFFPNRNKIIARRVNNAIGQYMRDSGLKTPNKPPGETTKYLYRGVDGKTAKNIIKYGGIRDGGYIAFSRSRDIASGYAAEGDPSVVLRLVISDLPHGIPWIWFLGDSSPTERNVVKSALTKAEEEVLLPPGSFVVKRVYRTAKFNTKVIKYIDVQYIPSVDSKTLSGKKIIRKLGPPKRDSQVQETTYDKQLAESFRRVMDLK